MIDSQKISFSALNLTIKDWNFDTLRKLKIVNINYGFNDSIFNKYYLNALCVDKKGDLYKITGLNEIKNWKNFISFLKKK